ncbi:S-adenosyl-L-methionine-dependent methyltransferase [Athelia psychrophila]|uniref:Protein-lysine N-methyltransferase EFM4 n=1 Tax=Athelia psychrophila TaxID=1759441 RepID=A0A166NNA4_9AGAM|nr:S-adenosyl-L-methionine-dependent methyltransferase [Fibularhizoctonia sp. CBS 109695]
MSVSELKPTKLGTKTHWDNVYDEELANFEELGDEGEIWFGEESVEKMVDWASEHVPASEKLSVLEIGSGNGTLLFALMEAGYPPANLSGIDYSPGSVKLSQSIAATRGGEQILFHICDFLKEEPPLLPSMTSANTWDLLLDKGTFDAIALMEKGENGVAPVTRYPAKVAKLLKPGGHFLITSCNFTEEELQASFVNDQTGLAYHSRIQHPTFTYGGKSGSICSSVAFMKQA